MKKLISAKMPYYAVAKGRKVGVFATWPECLLQVSGYRNALFKKFPTQAEATNFVSTFSGNQQIYKPKTPSDTSIDNERIQDYQEILNDPSTSHPKRLDTLSKYIKKLNDSPTDTLKRSNSGKGKKGVAKKSRKLGGSGEVPTDEVIPRASELKKFGVNYFYVDSNGFVHVYVDGSCENNGSEKAVAGLGVYFGDGHDLNRALPVTGRPTNNCGEIQAATAAIKLAIDNHIPKLLIHSDSQFLISAATDWMPKWKVRGWKKMTGEELENKTDFKELDNLLKNKFIQVQWNHVKAHSGIVGNERADKLAKMGGQKYKEQLEMLVNSDFDLETRK